MHALVQIFYRVVLVWYYCFSVFAIEKLQLHDSLVATSVAGILWVLSLCFPVLSVPTSN